MAVCPSPLADRSSVMSAVSPTAATASASASGPAAVPGRGLAAHSAAGVDVPLDCAAQLRGSLVAEIDLVGLTIQPEADGLTSILSQRLTAQVVNDENERLLCHRNHLLGLIGGDVRNAGSRLLQQTVQHAGSARDEGSDRSGQKHYFSIRHALGAAGRLHSGPFSPFREHRLTGQGLQTVGTRWKRPGPQISGDFLSRGRRPVTAALAVLTTELLPTSAEYPATLAIPGHRPSVRGIAARTSSPRLLRPGEGHRCGAAIAVNPDLPPCRGCRVRVAHGS